MPARLILLLVLLPILANRGAALEWKTQSISVTTAPFQATQEVVFEFRNHSAKPVAIVDLQTDCHCLQAAADAPVYAPGATGTVKARFSVGDRYGLYERTITVVTDESTQPVSLLARFEVPEIVTITPRSVAWKLNESAGEKSIELQSAAGLEITIKEVQVTDPGFMTRLETIEAGRRYRLHLKPQSTAQPGNTAVRFFAREKSGHDFVFSAYGNVQ